MTPFTVMRRWLSESVLTFFAHSVSWYVIPAVVEGMICLTPLSPLVAPSFRQLLLPALQYELPPVDVIESNWLFPADPVSAAQAGEQGNVEHVSKPGFWTRLVAEAPDGQEEVHVGVGIAKEQKPAVHEPQLASLSEGVAQSATVLQVGGGDGGGGGEGGGGDGGGDMNRAYRFMAL